MASFDFGKLHRPAGGTKPIDPIEIFRSSPALEQTPNDLWQGQSKALEQWHANRSSPDTLISLHTGAGKSLVGLIIAQSLVNEGISKVLYVCATNDLIRQTSREIDSKLGFPHTTRMSREFSNDLYSTGRAFCVSNYQALFNSRTVFRHDDRPEAIIFDDAHVAEKIIRDSYTIKIEREKHPEYSEIVQLIRPHFETINKLQYFDDIVRGTSSYRVALVPPGGAVALGKSGVLIEILRRAAKDVAVQFPLWHIADYLDRCILFVSADSVEIAPPILPSKRIAFLTDKQIRRIYLSATLTSEVDFCRAFGRRPSKRIEPVSDAGIGERLIVMTDREHLKNVNEPKTSDVTIARKLAHQNKVLVATPSYPSARKYSDLATPPTIAEFSDALDAF